MNVDEIYEEVLTTLNNRKISELKICTDWQEIVKLNEKSKNRCLYVINKKDYVYVGLYTKNITKYFNKNKLELQDKHYVKSENKYIKIFPNKIVYNKKACSFSTLRKVSKMFPFSELTYIFKKVYNIHPSLNIDCRNYNTVLLNEVQNITQDEFINNLFKDKKLSSTYINKLKEVDVNTIKIIYYIWDKCVDSRTRDLLLNDFYIDLDKDKIGNYYYLRGDKNREVMDWITSTTNKYNEGYYNNNIDHYIINNYNKQSALYKMIQSGVKDSVILARELFKKENKKFWNNNT